ncbi:MAG: DUF1801 domain-containing protein [Gemmatimonadaceae bacterium]
MVSSAAKTADAYLDSLPEDRRQAIGIVRNVVRKHLPKGYVEQMDFGMICYCVPLSRFSETYNDHPLCYAGLAAQKNYNAVYLMGVYGDGTNAKKFKAAFEKAGKKLDMGKSCVRFTSVDDLELTAIGDTIASMPVDDYIAMYEKSRLQTKDGQRRAAKNVSANKASAKKLVAKKATKRKP